MVSLKCPEDAAVRSDSKCDINATFLAKPSTVVVHEIGEIATQSADRLVLDETHGGICFFFINVLHTTGLRLTTVAAEVNVYLC